MAATQKALQFVPFTSAPDVSFWRELGRRKLDELGLDDAPIPVWGRYEVTAHGRSAGSVSVESSGFGDAAPFRTSGTHIVRGTLINTNTLEQFKNADKTRLMELAASELRDELSSDAPTSLARMTVLTFADLKSHDYYYWFGFPALAPAAPFVAASPIHLDEAIAPLTMASLVSAYERATSDDTECTSCFVVRVHVRGLVVREGDGRVQNEERAFEIGPLARWSEWCEMARAGGQPWPMLAFADSVAEGECPGWPARNLLMWASAQRASPETVQLICWREPPRARAAAAHAAPSATPCRSVVLGVRLVREAEGHAPEAAAQLGAGAAVGWERNVRGKLGARMVSLRAQLDPQALAEASVDLNLRLMRWRLLPELQTQKLRGLRCLLIGAGTLGCNVARALLGWGVREITFVDGGAVSHSNPVRQSLFTFADCAASERRSKAVAAAQAVQQIFPGARAVGFEAMVPMPGHPVSEPELASVRAAVELLEQLIERHDAVFLLTDTRESRWLPALLCAAKSKLAITAALGFDSFLVMRHGTGPSSPAHAEGEAEAEGAAEAEAKETAQRLGCYFCNDVVAPVDSTRDRTLDQQCTVTRPGLSMMASALAVEMLVSLAHHPLEHAAPADSFGAEMSTPLGLLPHQVRGFLPSFRTELLRGQAFSCCVACSSRAVAGYRTGGFDFLLRAFNETAFLEEFSGLKQLQEQAEVALKAWECDDADLDEGF